MQVLAVDYQNSSALFQCAADGRVLDVVAAILGTEDVELFGNGQLVYKEPGGGHQVSFHQDAAFFEFGGTGMSPVRRRLNAAAAATTTPPPPPPPPRRPSPVCGASLCCRR